MTHTLKLHSVRSGNMIEFLVSRNENQLEGALTRGIHYNWLALPQLEVSCQLANLDDDFWNREQISGILENPYDVETLIMTIHELSKQFNYSKAKK